MKIFTLIAFIMMITSFTIKAQEGGTMDQFKINLLTPGIGYEKKLGTKGTLDLTATGYFSWVGSDTYIKPSIDIGYRYYYNILRRESRGRNIKGNSASFLIASIGYTHRNITKSKYLYNTNPIGFDCKLQWGIRRTFNWFYLEGKAGGCKQWWHHTDLNITTQEPIGFLGELTIGFLIQ
ncbi:hypothetical protein K4L44_12830 [Halosquirtibacter laminarini]|uniref:Uncharacterized protein n=1 Tax=Halosquirtibacter laminarini TaxID=3374600 RepID=A0AC61NMP8_9BACT|nr:hypothetical protein K4L44_12830 [Prolixibacteraceae bacterium]